MNKLIPIAIIAATGGGILYALHKNKSTLIDVKQLKNNRQMRTDEKLAELAESVNELYLLHGVTLNKEELTNAVQEFLDSEEKENSLSVFKAIETRLSKDSNKGLEFGAKYGLYGGFDANKNLRPAAMLR